MQMGLSWDSKPLWRVWGPTNASVAYILVPTKVNWADSTSDTLSGHMAAQLLPDAVLTFDRTISDYVVCAVQRPPARPLYMVRLKDYGAGSTDSILSAALGTVNWAPVRWLLRDRHTDWEQY